MIAAPLAIANFVMSAFVKQIFYYIFLTVSQSAAPAAAPAAGKEKSVIKCCKLQCVVLNLFLLPLSVQCSTDG